MDPQKYLVTLIPLSRIDYYGVTFDHLVPAGDTDPEVLQINIIETDDDCGDYANRWLPFEVNAKEYKDRAVLAVPRCCQNRKGTQDRRKVNESVTDREKGDESAKGPSDDSE